MRIQWGSVVLVVAALLMSQASAVADEQVDAEAVKSLVKQLSHPNQRTRERAEREIKQLPPESAEALEAASKNLPHEARLRLVEIIDHLKASRQGAVVLSGWNGEPSHFGAGSVIYRIESTPVRSREDFHNFFQTVPNGDYKAYFRGERGLDVKGSYVRDKVHYDPCEVLFPYEEPYGDKMQTAARAFEDGAFDQALKAFGEAAEAGAKLEESDVACVLYAECLYHMDRVADAEAELEELAARMRDRGEKEPWREVSRVYRMAVEPSYYINIPTEIAGRITGGFRDEHLSKMVRDRAVEERPKGSYVTEVQSFHTLRILGDYPRGIAQQVRELNSVKEDGMANVPNRMKARLSLMHVFRDLQMKDPMRPLMAALAKDWANYRFVGVLADFAEYLQEDEAALELWRRETYRDGSPTEGTRSGWGEYRYLVREGRFDDAMDWVARAFENYADLSELKPEHLFLRWPEMHARWADIAAKVAESPKDKSHHWALLVLLYQPDADVDQLERLMEMLRKDRGVKIGGKTVKDPIPRQQRCMLALARREYRQALAVYEEEGAKIFHTYREFLEFAAEHEAAIRDLPAPWCDLRGGVPWADHGWLVIAADHQMGLCSPDATRIQPIAWPDPTWSFEVGYNLFPQLDVFFVSCSGRTMGLRKGQYVYGTQPEAGQWTKLMTVSPGNTENKDYYKYRPLLDDMYDAVKRRGGEYPMMYPAGVRIGRQRVGGRVREVRGAPEGDWLAITFPPNAEGCREPEAAVFHDLGLLLGEAVGEPRRIYHLAKTRSTADRREDDPRYYCFTDAGLLHFDVGRMEAVAIELPDGLKDRPVVRMEDKKWLPDAIRVARLPQDGGAIFQYNWKTGEFHAESGRNHCYPSLYWTSRPVEDNLDDVKAAVIDMGFSWPLEIPPLQVTEDSEPMKIH